MPMKRLVLLLILLSASTFTLFAQLKLDSQGKTIVGTYSGDLKFECQGVSKFTRWGYGWENINIDWVNNYGAAQIYCTSSNFSIGIQNHYVGSGYFHYLMLTYSPFIGSDLRLKENISPITSALDKIMLINGKRFNYIDVLGEDLKVTPLRERITKPTFGFIAQELIEVLPEIVAEPDELNEYYGVNYTAMIPLLVEAIKEQQLQIAEQQLHIAELQQLIANIGQEEIEEKSIKIQNNANTKKNSSVNATLYQNTPNPFSTETEIRYYVPNNAGQASLLIFDMQGAMKKQMQITAKGDASITISAMELPAGMYIYSLIVDGIEIDCKKMILAK